MRVISIVRVKVDGESNSQLNSIPLAGASGLNTQRNQLRSADTPVAGYQRNAVHYAGCRDDLVGRVALEIQLCNRPRDFEIQWPDSHAREHLIPCGGIQIEAD